MTFTLLIDLDDTLLENPLEVFLPAYLQALSSHLQEFAPSEKIISSLQAGTRQMTLNNQPDCSLEDVFASVFYPQVGLPPASLKSAIDDFYQRIFPVIRQYTRPVPGAVRLVEEAFARGYRVAIATTPLFPAAATLQRLEWAGLPADRYPFNIVASFETFHFAKPNPAFLAETLARMGWPDGPVVMVGDDLKNDILPALHLELPAYWLRGNASQLPEAAVPRTAGDLEGLLPWLEQHPPEEFTPRFSTPQAILAVLRSTPAALGSLCYPLTDAAWTGRPLPGEWAPVEIVCHLRDVEFEVNLSRLRQVLAGDNPFIPGQDTDPWAEQRQYILQDGPRALERFISTRQRVLSLLEGLPPGQWDLPARHAIFGPTTLLELASIMARHDRLHIRQFYDTCRAG